MKDDQSAFSIYMGNSSLDMAKQMQICYGKKGDSVFIALFISVMSDKILNLILFKHLSRISSKKKKSQALLSFICKITREDCNLKFNYNI